MRRLVLPSWRVSRGPSRRGKADASSESWTTTDRFTRGRLYHGRLEEEDREAIFRHLKRKYSIQENIMIGETITYLRRGRRKKARGKIIGEREDGYLNVKPDRTGWRIIWVMPDELEKTILTPRQP